MNNLKENFRKKIKKSKKINKIKRVKNFIKY